MKRILLILFIIFILPLVSCLSVEDMLIFPDWDTIVYGDYDFTNTQLATVPPLEKNYFKLTQNGITLNALWIKASPDTYPGKIVLFCDGNRNNLYSALKTGVTLRNYGFNYLTFEYRGYGLSYGSIQPTEETIYADAKAAMDFLMNSDLITGIRSINGEATAYTKDDIIIVGYSLGTAVATNTAYVYTTGTATVDKPALLALFAPIANASILAKELAAGYSIPNYWYTAAKVDNLSKVRSIYSPLCIFHGTIDFVVPYRNSEYLFPAANEPKYFYTGTGLGHGFLRGTTWWEPYFVNFVNNNLP